MMNSRFLKDRQEKEERQDCLQDQMKKLAKIAHSLHNMNMSAIKTNRLKKEKAKVLQETKEFTERIITF